MTLSERLAEFTTTELQQELHDRECADHDEMELLQRENADDGICIDERLHYEAMALAKEAGWARPGIWSLCAGRCSTD